MKKLCISKLKLEGIKLLSSSNIRPVFEGITYVNYLRGFSTAQSGTETSVPLQWH